MSTPEDQNDLKAFEARLAAHVPRDDRLDRERLAFLAGQASAMNAPAQRSRVLGVSVDSRVWPAAFAAMSAVAATLLFLLVARPEAPGAISFAAGNKMERVGDTPAKSLPGTQNVLTTQDARYNDLETRLAKLEAERKGSDTVTPTEKRTVPVYTPSAWQQVINESEPSRPTPRKSSSISHRQGINT
jgi:hypothetical protein